MADFTYSAEPILEIDGDKAPEKLMEDLLYMTVDESISLPSMFTLAFQNSALSGQEEAEVWEHADLFDFGKPITIGFTSSTTASESFDEQIKEILLQGEITAIETHFTPGSQAPIIIHGYDPSHRLHRGRFNRSFQNVTDSDVVKKIAGEAGISVGTVDDSGAPHDYIFQQNQTNMEFLRSRAARCGFELFVKDGKLNFRKPKGDDSIELTWLKDLSSFQVRVSSAEQVSSVEVRGWDYQQKKPFIATKSSEQLITETDYGDGKKTSNVFNEKPSDPKMTVVDQPVFTQKEADTIAQALFNELSGEFVLADAKAEGNPKIRPGQVVKLAKMGKYSGKYYVTEARHRFSERVYSTEFSVRGLRGSDLLSILAPPARAKVGQTLLVGVVADNQDPEGLGRVRVKCPTLTEEHESNWARVVGVGVGNNRGFDCLPEIDDEVLVGFEHGDIHRPYILGGVWNGQDAPPESVDDSVVDSKVRLRTFKTRTGHSLQFVEEDKGSSKKGIQVLSVYGHEIYLNDSEKVIKIKTKGGHQLTLDDKGKKIEMISTGTIAVEAPTQISLKVGSSKVQLTQSGVEVTSMNSMVKGTAQTKIEGALVDVTAQGIAKIKEDTKQLG